MAISAAEATALGILVNVVLPLREWFEINGDRLRGVPWRDPGGAMLETDSAQTLSAKALSIAGLLDLLLALDTDGPALKPLWRSLEASAPVRRAAGVTAPDGGFIGAKFGIAASANVAATWVFEQDCEEILASSDRIELYGHGLPALSAAYQKQGDVLPPAAWVEALMTDDNKSSGWTAPKMRHAHLELKLSSEHFCTQLLRDVLIVLISQRLVNTGAPALHPFALALESGDPRRPGNAFSATQTERYTASFSANIKKL